MGHTAQFKSRLLCHISPYKAILTLDSQGTLQRVRRLSSITYVLQMGNLAQGEEGTGPRAHSKSRTQLSSLSSGIS